MLRKFVSVYVPSTRHAVPVTKHEHNLAVKRIETEFSKEFGGFTTTPGVGGWLSDTHGLITEPVTIVTSYYDDSHSGTALEFARRIACDVKAEFEQEAVTVGTEEGIEFV